MLFNRPFASGFAVLAAALIANVSTPAPTQAQASQLDGIEFTPDGGFIFSSWGNQTVHRITADGTMVDLVEGVTAPADIGIDLIRNRVLVPLFMDNELWIRDID